MVNMIAFGVIDNSSLLNINDELFLFQNRITYRSAFLTNKLVFFIKKVIFQVVNFPPVFFCWPPRSTIADKNRRHKHTFKGMRLFDRCDILIKVNGCFGINPVFEQGGNFQNPFFYAF